MIKSDILISREQYFI